MRSKASKYKKSRFSNKKTTNRDQNEEGNKEGRKKGKLDTMKCP